VGDRLLADGIMKLPHRRQFLHLTAGAAALPALSRIAKAQAYPIRPIRAIVPAGAGSAVDVIPRLVFDQVSKQLGQPIVVENRTGAGGTIGIAAVTKAEPDGYTLLAASSALTVAPSIYKTLPYDTARDLSSIVAFGSVPNVLVTSPAKGLLTLQAFIAAAKDRPGTFNYASAGVGTATHMSAELFRIRAGIEAVHVPLKGGPEAMTEVLSGRADFYLCPLNTALPFVREGKLLALVVSGSKRAPELPDVRTTTEAGLHDADYLFWVGLFAPSRTPRTVINKLHGETLKALETPSVRDKLAAVSVTPMPTTPEQFDAQIKGELASNAILVKTAGIQPDSR
jgi:tripartite-type tricarboxylate transporter receptor subunit TctC